MKIYNWDYEMMFEEDDENPVYKIIDNKFDYDLGLNYTHNFAEFYDGRIIPDIFGNFSSFNMDPNARGLLWPDISFFAMHWILVSKKMRNAIERFSVCGDYQWIDTLCIGDNEKDYKLFNCLRHINCINKKTVAPSSEPRPDNPILRKNSLYKVSGLFGVAEYPALLMATEDLHEYCINEGMNQVRNAPEIEVA